MEVKGQILNRQLVRSELFYGLLHILNVLGNALLLGLPVKFHLQTIPVLSQWQLHISLVPAEDASPPSPVQHPILGAALS